MKYRILTLITLLLFLSSCQSEMVTYNGEAQGTTYRVIFERGPFLSPSYWINKAKLDALLDQFDLSLSAYIPESVISRINMNDPDVMVDDYFSVVFTKAYEVWMSTEGYFDLTVAPLVNAYGFGPNPLNQTGEVNVDSLLRFVGMDLVNIENGKLVKKFQEVQLDVNAIAQGYAVDVLGEFLESKKVQNYLVEIGGEIRTRGQKPEDQTWKVGIDKPVENNFTPGANLQVIIKMNDHALATSGNYRKFYEMDGVKYSHSINPLSGRPVMDTLLSATVVTSDCMTADAYATAFMVMGLARSKTFLLAHTDLEAYLVYSDGAGEFKVWYTEGMEAMVED